MEQQEAPVDVIPRLYKNEEQRKRLLDWLTMFFDPFYPYCLRILDDEEFHKDKPLEDIGKYFIHPMADPQNKLQLRMLYLLPDDPLIYELFITALAVKMDCPKKTIVQSFRDFSVNLKKHGDFDNISELTYRTVIKNLEDDYDVYAIKQNPQQCIELFIASLRNRGKMLGLKEEHLKQIQENIEKYRPKFLIKNNN